MARVDQRKELERLCCYICCPAVSEKRIAMTAIGCIRYQLKTPYRDGTTHVFFQPLDFIALAHPCARGMSASLHVIARPAALIPKPRIQSYRILLSPLSYVHVGNIDLEKCDLCGNTVKGIACIEDPAVIKQRLTHLKERIHAVKKYALPEGRSPPQARLFVE